MVETIHRHILTTPRMLFAMAEQKQLPQVLAAIHRRFRTPHISICFSAAVILACALSGIFIQLAAVSVITRVPIYFVTCVGLPLLRRKRNISVAMFTLPGGLAIPLAAVELCGWLLSNSERHELWMSTTAAGCGLLLYSVQELRQSAHPAS
jgi:amino acid transporter